MSSPPATTTAAATGPLDSSALVVAHPDDENLWFSSVLGKVDAIVVCFLDVATRPDWSQGRRRSLAEYPLANLHCLELPEGGVFEGVDWDRAVTSEFGLQITEGRLSDTLYRRNFHDLKALLRPLLRGRHNVFTHNPWGEYGHVEHVQVFRAVRALQDELRFTLWFSNYASNKSAGFMMKQLAEMHLQAMALPTDRELAHGIADIYRRNGCWTWYDDYRWADEEAFLREVGPSAGAPQYGSLLPLNMLSVPPAPRPVPARRRSPFKAIRRRVRRLTGR